MEVHQLRYFCAVVETGSFTRAAAREHVAQPSLSQQIMKLEEELGALLFDRLGRTVRLTDLGQTFLPRARAILRELQAAKDEVVERKSSVSGPVSIGVIPTIAPYFLPSRIATFSRKFPDSSLSVVEDITLGLMDRLRAGTIDMALMALPLRGHDFETFPLRTERLFAILPKGHELARKRSLMMKELREEPFLLLRDDRFQLLNVAMFFEELVEQHCVHRFVAHGVNLAGFVASHQVRINLRHLLGHKSELRNA